MATMGVLFVKAESPSTGAASRVRAPRTVAVRPRTQCPIMSNAPVQRSPPATTNRAAMVNSTGLANPARACWGVTTPTSVSTAKAARNRKSAATARRRCNRTNSAATTARVTQPCQFMVSSAFGYPVPGERRGKTSLRLPCGTIGPVYHKPGTCRHRNGIIITISIYKVKYADIPGKSSTLRPVSAAGSSRTTRLFHLPLFICALSLC